MFDVYQRHHRQDPLHRVAPIPSITVQLPVAAAVQANLCYSARYLQQQSAVSPEDVRATALQLLQAAKLLESDANAQAIQQLNQIPGHKERRQYFLKRNYAGRASKQTALDPYNSSP